MSSKILIVDDDSETAETLKALLEPSAFEVKIAATVMEGITAVRKYNPDVIVVNIIFPGINCAEICREIRRFSNIPILVMSALNEPGIIAKVLDDGADDYLCKPVHNGVLVAHLNKLIRRTQTIRRSPGVDDCYIRG